MTYKLKGMYIFPPSLNLISNGEYILPPSSAIPSAYCFKDHRIKCMLNIVSFVRECIGSKRACSLC